MRYSQHPTRSTSYR